MIVGLLVVAGALAADDTLAGVRAHLPAVRRCYERALAADPNPPGKLVVGFTVGADGKVTEAREARAPDDPPVVGPDALTACVLAVFRGMTFAPTPAATERRYPLLIDWAG